MQGLPFAFFTPSSNYVTSLALRNAAIPANLQLTKYYFQPQVAALQEEMDHARSLGFGAADEWHKGLEAAGKEKLADSGRWEQWEASGGLPLQAARLSAVPTTAAPSRSASVDASTVLSHTNGNFPKSFPLPSFSTSLPLPNMSPFVHPPAPGKADDRLGLKTSFITFLSLDSLKADCSPGTLPQASNKPSTPLSGPFSVGTIQNRPPMPVPIQPHVPQPRVERSIRDVNQMKADKRADIERRCSQLTPPIQPSTLVYMDSFANALQIPMPLNDGSWEVLKSRLLAQREIAEQREREQTATNRQLQAQAEERRQEEAQLIAARDALNRQWEELQKPGRERLEGFADEIIRRDWQDGRAVNGENSPRFAADVLIYVHKRFRESLAHENALLMAQGMARRQDVQGDSSHKLTLENMKWVYETKVKPFTEHFRKELFLCSVCDNPTKFYALDAVIQHYAAKHTSSLSQGTAVVYWKAEWPEEPLFDPEPNAYKVSAQPMSWSTGFTAYSNGPSLMPTPENRYQTGMAQSQYRATASSDQQAPPFNNGQDIWPSTKIQSATRYDLGIADDSHSHVGQQRFQDQPYHSQSTDRVPKYGVTSPATGPRHEPHAQAWQPPGPVVRPQSNLSHSVVSSPVLHNWTPAPHTQAGAWVHAISTGPPGQPSGIYQVQIEELARHAREVWEGTDGIRDMPSSIRIKVIIHHAVLRFAEKFTNEPNVSLFTDAINNRSQLKPLRSLDGLACKACASSNDEYNPSDAGLTAIANNRLYALPELLTHFQTAHLQHGQQLVIPQTGIELPRLDWKFDMVELPGDSIVHNLMYAPGIDFNKLSLIATVLPKYFPSPLPRIDPIPNLETAHKEIRNPLLVQRSDTMNSRAHTPSHTANGRGGALEVSVDNFPKFMDSPRRNAPRPSEPAGDDEYDPSRPQPAYKPPHLFEQPVHTEPHSSLRYETIRRPDSPERGANTAAYNANAYATPFEYTRPVTYIQEPRGRFSPPSRFAVRDEHSEHRYMAPRSPPRRYILADDEVDYVRKRGEYEYDTEIRYLEPPKIAERLGSVRRERQPSAPTEFMNAAEHFLNNFDSIATGDNGDIAASQTRATEIAQSPLREEGKPLESAEEALEILPKSEAAVNGRRLADETGGGLDSGYNADGKNADLRAPQTSIPRATSILRNDEDGNATYGPKHGANYRLHTEANDAGPDERRYRTQQASHPGGVEQFPPERLYYRERSPIRRPQPIEIYEPLSPEVPRRPYAPEERVRYAEPPPRQIRYVEDSRYVDQPPYDQPVRYVRVAPDDPMPGRYYVDRHDPIELPNDHVRYDRGYREEPVYERDGQLYRRAAPPPPPPPQNYDVYQDQYGRPVRYQ